MTPPQRRVPVRLLLAVFAALAFALTACSSEGAKTDCNLDSCTVTFDRTGDAKAEILGVEAKLVGVQGETATVEVGGQQADITVGNQTEVGGFNVSLTEVTDSNVKVKIERQ